MICYLTPKEVEEGSMQRAVPFYTPKKKYPVLVIQDQGSYVNWYLPDDKNQIRRFPMKEIMELFLYAGWTDVEFDSDPGKVAERIAEVINERPKKKPGRPKKTAPELPTTGASPPAVESLEPADDPAIPPPLH